MKRLLATIVLLQAICLTAPVYSESVTHHYTVTVDYSLSRLWVEARYAHVVDSITARSRDAGKFLVDVRGCPGEAQIRMRNRRMMLPDSGTDCLNYTIDLDRAASAYRNNRTLAAENIVVPPSYWLWRPELHNGTRIRISFRLPENVRVSVPWRQLDPAGTIYLLGRSPESAYSPVVFGDFDYRELEVPGAVLRVALLAGNGPMDNDAIADWIKATATDVSLAYGRFPNPSPQVVVIPVGDTRSNTRSAVPFGRVVRDGGESIELFVDQTQPLDALLTDWTATHEFSHLMLPYLERGHHWISEGFAQYYQNVLLARSGAYADLYAWQKLYDGYERGRQSRPELSPNEAAAGEDRSGRMKVYWSGAALALMADVILRERSGGEETLDVVLGRFQSCCLPSIEVWSGPELFTKLDSLVSEPVFMPLYRRYADTAGFPDTSEFFKKLGLAVSDNEVRMKRNAELKAVRDSITMTNSATASWRQDLAAFHD